MKRIVQAGGRTLVFQGVLDFLSDRDRFYYTCTRRPLEGEHGARDSQVQYYEPAKWVARLRSRKTDDRPLVFSVDMTSGHLGASGRLQAYRDTAREYAFILDQFGMAR